MINDPSTRRRMIQIGALVTPVVVVQVARVMLGAGPAVAPAATDAGAQGMNSPEMIAALDDPSIQTTDAQQAARQWCASLDFDAMILSPLDHPDPVGDEGPVEPGVDPIDLGPESAPRLVLTAVVAGSNGAVAFIEGRVFRVGDEVAPGWSVESIDARSRRVVIVGEGDAEIVLTPDLER